MANLKHYKCEYYEIDAPENSCLFCKHCHDVFYDGNGPYAYGCDLEEQDIEDIGCACKVHFGLRENCENFEEDEE